jgi:hypothetical protein
LLTVAPQGEGQAVVRFSPGVVDWDVFEIGSVYQQGLWAGEFRDILWNEAQEGERLSIQRNDHWLNNLSLQSCDVPVGYPAFVSGFFPSRGNAFDKY